MIDSICVILPVHNAQATLAHQVAELLELLPEKSTQFEVLIVDDASSDRTEEVAHDLSRFYPQVRLIRHSQPVGLKESARTGMKQAAADVVMIHDQLVDLLRRNPANVIL